MSNISKDKQMTTAQAIKDKLGYAFKSQDFKKIKILKKYEMLITL